MAPSLGCGVRGSEVAKRRLSAQGGLVFDYQTHGRRLPGHRAILGAAQKDGIPADEWYSDGARVERSYRRMEAIRLMLATKHYGPWHETGPLALAATA
jgi:hypothetical protein